MLSLFCLGGMTVSKLINITTEDAFGALPHVMDLYEKLDLDGYRKKVALDLKKQKLQEQKVDVNEIGIDLFKYVLKNLPKVKEEIFSIIGIFENKTADEVKKQPALETAKSLKAIFTDKEVMDFFKESME